jgi:biotin synthase-like enzyme
MMDESDLEILYNKLTKLAESEEYDVSHVARTIAIFRVAIEYGVTTMGFPLLTYLMAKLLTVALGIMAGDESATYEDILDDFEEEVQLKH